PGLLERSATPRGARPPRLPRHRGSAHGPRFHCPDGRVSARAQNGFTLLEVLVALVILSLAVVTFIQLASQGLRLLRVAGEHQEAVMLADRLARPPHPSGEGIEAGRRGAIRWGG